MEENKVKKIGNPSLPKLTMDLSLSTGELEKRLFATYDRIIKMVSDADVYECDFLFGVGDRVLNSPLDLHKRERGSRPSTALKDWNKRPSSRSRSRGFNLSTLPPLPQLPEFANLKKMKTDKNVGNVVELEDLLAEAEQLVEIENFLEKYSLQVLENLDADEFNDDDGADVGKTGTRRDHKAELEEMEKKIKSKFGFSLDGLTNSINPDDVTKCLSGQKNLNDIVGAKMDTFGQDECKVDASEISTKIIKDSEGSGDRDQKSNLDLDDTCTSNEIDPNDVENDEDCPNVDINKNETFIQQIKKCQEAMKNLEIKESLLFGKDAERAYGNKTGSKNYIALNKMRKWDSNASQSQLSKSKFHLPPLNNNTYTTSRTTPLDKDKKTKPSEISTRQMLQGLRKINKTSAGLSGADGEMPSSAGNSGASVNSFNRLVPLAKNQSQPQLQNKKVTLGDSKYPIVGTSSKGKLLPDADIEKWKQNYCEMKEKKKSLLSSPQSKSASSIQLKQQLLGVKSGIAKSIKSPFK